MITFANKKKSIVLMFFTKYFDFTLLKLGFYFGGDAMSKMISKSFCQPSLIYLMITRWDLDISWKPVFLAGLTKGAGGHCPLEVSILNITMHNTALGYRVLQTHKRFGSEIEQISREQAPRQHGQLSSQSSLWVYGSWHKDSKVRLQGYILG